jgi:hemerythrin
MGIEWRESLSIGIEEIDSQHKLLLSHFDQLLKWLKHHIATVDVQLGRFLKDDKTTRTSGCGDRALSF